MTLYDLEYERAIRAARKEMGLIRWRIKAIEDILASIDWEKEAGEPIERSMP